MTQYRFNIESSLCHVCVFRVSRGITRCSHLLVPERIALCSCSWSLLLVQSPLLRRCFCLVQLRPSATVETNQRFFKYLFKNVFNMFQDFSYSAAGLHKIFCPGLRILSFLRVCQCPGYRTVTQGNAIKSE